MTAQAAIFSLLGLDPTGSITASTQFDPDRMDIPFANPTPGKLAPWERPLVAAFDAVNDVQKATQPLVRAVRRTVFGPEQ